MADGVAVLPWRDAKDLMMTVAAVDRLVHHGVIFEIKSDSYRRQAATTRSNKSKAS